LHNENGEWVVWLPGCFPVTHQMSVTAPTVLVGRFNGIAIENNANTDRQTDRQTVYRLDSWSPVHRKWLCKLAIRRTQGQKEKMQYFAQKVYYSGQFEDFGKRSIRRSSFVATWIQYHAGWCSSNNLKVPCSNFPWSDWFYRIFLSLLKRGTKIILLNGIGHNLLTRSSFMIIFPSVLKLYSTPSDNQCRNMKHSVHSWVEVNGKVVHVLS
jgi:hypothetical protein